MFQYPGVLQHNNKPIYDDFKISNKIIAMARAASTDTDEICCMYMW